MNTGITTDLSHCDLEGRGNMYIENINNMPSSTWHKE
jgi:hypothetical protein